MLGRARITRLLIVVALTLWLGSTGVSSAIAASETPSGDIVQLTKVSAARPTNASAEGPVSFEAIVDYRLQTAPRAFFLLFVFEDSSNTSTTDSSDGTWVSSGSSQIHLTATYRPSPGVHTLTLAAGLFRDQNTLLAWAVTQPFSLSPAPGGALFAKVLAARQDGDYAKAVNDLTAA